jgi:arylsulfatase A-like enzyme
LVENTLVICTSDNGTSPTTSQINQLIKKGHYPSGRLRGSKADLWDGGHRVPFIVSWPGKIESNSRTNALIGLTDLFATVAEVVGASFPPSEGVDSESFLPVLLGKADTSRTTLVHHSVSGKFAIRDQSWKLLLAPGSGGWSDPRDPKAKESGWPKVQLYALDEDLGETNNLLSKQPERALKMRAMLEAQVTKGRSTPGPQQQNDVKIDIDKPEKVKKKSANSKH